MGGSDLFTGTLDILVLRAVAVRPSHGYAIGRHLREGSDGVLDVEEGALYPALHRLEAKGFLVEEWGFTETNREAKFYRLTPAGRKQLANELKRWQNYSRIMSAALAASR